MIRFVRQSFAVLAAVLVMGGTMQAAPVAARDVPLSIKSNFRIGNAGVRCTAQSTSRDPRISDMFDRGYRLTCQDAASAVGTLLVLRDQQNVAAAPQGLPEGSSCSAGESDIVEGVGAVTRRNCRDVENGIAYRRYSITRANETYMVEGLAGYDPALRLALSSAYNDRTMPGTVEVVQTEVSDAAAFARIQAGSLSALDVRNEGYRRNNSGRYAEAEEFFGSLASRNRDNPRALAEALANQGMQQSNLGNFVAASRLFLQAQDALTSSDGVTQRLIRNYQAVDYLNQQYPDIALDILGEEMMVVDDRFEFFAIRDGFIDNPLSEQINRENIALQRLGGVDLGLSAGERAEILDAQAEAIAGSALRQKGDLAGAEERLRLADTRIAGVRDGRVASARWLRSEIAIERALVAEARGQVDAAVRFYDRSALAISRRFPQSPSLLATYARKAGFLLRVGRTQEGRELFADVVTRSADVTDSGASLRNLLQPYFSLLANDGSPEATAELFAATSLLQRPGVAQTQAILARQMSEGDDDAAALFRLSLNRSREIARTQARADRLAAIAEPNEAQIEGLAEAETSLEYLRGEQTRLLARLAEFPRFRALAPSAPQLADLQSELREGEAYYKLIIVGEQLYALWIDGEGAFSFPIEGSLYDLEDDVQFIRDSIVVIEAGQTVTYPFEVDRARALYLKLFGPVEDRLGSVDHLVFEPDGPMLQLPPQVLVAAQEGVDAYNTRMEDPEADPYDYRGVEWLGRGREVSIAVSPRGFIDIRNIAPSSARNGYFGVGSNALPNLDLDLTQSCDWPAATWQDPIASDELYFAAEKFGENSKVAVGEDFSDTALLGDEGLSDYRVIHFATHGLVTAPAPSCPARPALVTSFGDETSDGLLTFKEIFDLQLDADLVILSACDTAGMATAAASREAGVTTGGNYALDGLVRAFVGAGARTVIASHWPVPDDFDATQRLIEGMIGGEAGQSLGTSMTEAQQGLMDEADTSHPFYWAAFIVLGDGSKALQQ